MWDLSTCCFEGEGWICVGVALRKKVGLVQVLQYYLEGEDRSCPGVASMFC